MVLHRPHGEHELPGNFAVGVARGEEAQHFRLLPAQAGRARWRRIFGIPRTGLTLEEFRRFGDQRVQFGRFAGLQLAVELGLSERFGSE